MKKDLYSIIGNKIKQIRRENGWTLYEIASRTGVSKSLLSKIENVRTIPSLPVLFKIIKALEMDVAIFFEGVSDITDITYTHIKAEEYEPMDKEDSEGFSYFSIINESVKNAELQVAILKLSPGATREKVVTDGFTFLYLIDGNVDYLLEEETVKFKTGDSLFFNGRIPHVPMNLSSEVAVMLIVYLLNT